MDELEEALKKKDEDMKQMEERYKKYLEKAKSVSIDLLQKCQYHAGIRLKMVSNEQAFLECKQIKLYTF